jgi:hypothetical protein
VDWFNTAANWTMTEASDGLVGPGDTVHLCGVISTSLDIQGSGIENNPITILFEKDARMSAPYWDTWMPTPGGPKTPSVGAINASQKNYIVIDGGANGVIEATDNGTDRTYQYSFAGIHAASCANWKVKNLTVRNLYDRVRDANDPNIFGMGIVMTNGSDISVHDNRIEKAYYGIDYYTVYPDTQNIEIYNNELVGTCISLVAALGNTGASLNNVLIHHNHIYDNNVWDGVIDPNPYDPSRNFHRKDGIKLWGRSGTDDEYSDVKIYNNVIGPGISSTSGSITAWICLDHGNYIGAEIHHNLLLSNDQDVHPGDGFISLHGSVDGQVHNARIYNNTLVGTGMGHIMSLDRSGGLEVHDNIFYDFGAGLWSSRGVALDHWNNNCWYPARNYRSVISGTTYYWADWLALGYDSNSPLENPLFLNMDNPVGPDGIFWTGDDGLRLQVDSPCIGAGRFGGDIGAYEFVPDVYLRGAPGDQTIYLDWNVNVTLPATATWHIDYYTTTLTVPFTATDPFSITRAYTLTDHVTNYEWYTVTLHALVDSTSFLSDTVRVMPTDISVYLPLMMKED